VRRHSFASAAAATAVCGGSAGGGELSDGEAVCDVALGWASKGENARDTVRLVTDESWETDWAMQGQGVEPTTKVRDCAADAD
jgi:hypothetical protein